MRLKGYPKTDYTADNSTADNSTADNNTADDNGNNNINSGADGSDNHNDENNGDNSNNNTMRWDPTPHLNIYGSRTVSGNEAFDCNEWTFVYVHNRGFLEGTYSCLPIE